MFASDLLKVKQDSSEHFFLQYGDAQGQAHNLPDNFSKLKI